jgi:phosphoribosyl-ATP pyrophosphohydrolase/phosphoribosyl-AMP cyclohydrolase/histidinol dehydrogenase
VAIAELLRRVEPSEIRRARPSPVDDQTLAAAAEIVRIVRDQGEPAVRHYAERFGERRPGEPLCLDRSEMRAALGSLVPEDRGALERAHERILAFASAQRRTLHDLEWPIPGGRAGHTIEPIEAVGCYAPAGRYPLPSSVLMTAASARAAGCERVVVASPGARPVMLAAAAIAGADEFLAVGGAHAVGAMAHGFEGFDPVDKIIGPGNRWVTAAKLAVSGVVGIDMLAGPSELVVLADEGADAVLVAADLLAQAEHDTDARAILVTTCERLARGVEAELARQLDGMNAREDVLAALCNGFVCVARDLEEAVRVVDAIAPEHLEIMTMDSERVAASVRHAGAIFVGAAAAEVLGDYGIGPNHTLPTGGTARFRAGLSVVDLVRHRTWVRIDDLATAEHVISDTRRLADLEGLSAHARSAALRAGA